MKSRIRIYFMLPSLLLATATAQTTFTNMDFESANLPTIPAGNLGGFVPVADALPGWTAFLGSTARQEVYHNNYTLGTASISILGPDWPPGQLGDILEGRYSVFLQRGHNPGGPPGDDVDASIAQVGLIPNFAQSLRFLAGVDVNNLTLSVSGQNLAYVQVSTFGNYGLFAADISAFSGLSAEVRFTSHAWISLDAITFSPLPVPEPAFVSLVALGVLGLWATRRWLAGPRRCRRNPTPMVSASVSQSSCSR